MFIHQNLARVFHSQKQRQLCLLRFSVFFARWVTFVNRPLRIPTFQKNVKGLGIKKYLPTNQKVKVKYKGKKETEGKRETFTALMSRKTNMQYFSLNIYHWSRSNRFWCWYIFKLLPILGGIQKMQQCFHVNCSVSIAPWENEAFPAIKILLTELWSYFSTRPTWDHKLGFFFFIFVVVIATNDY